jgi:hypothetical protein
MLHDHVEISLLSYKTMLEQHNLGEPHITLVGGEKWYPQDERRQLHELTHNELERLGLARGGRLSPDFLDTVQVLQRPGIEFYTWSSINGGHVTVRTAFSGRDAVLAIANSETLSLWPSSPDTAAQDLVAQLPDTPPANVHSMSCAEADYQAVLRGNAGHGGASARDAKQVVRWLKAPRLNVGQLYVAIRDSGGTRRRTEKPPFWIDTDSGRIVAGVDVSGWLSLSGAAPQDLVAKLHRMEAELRGRRG